MPPPGLHPRWALVASRQAEVLWVGQLNSQWALWHCLLTFERHTGPVCFSSGALGRRVTGLLWTPRAGLLRASQGHQSQAFDDVCRLGPGAQRAAPCRA